MENTTTLVPALEAIFANNLHLGHEMQRLMLKQKSRLLEGGETPARAAHLLAVYFRKAADAMFLRLVFKEADNPVWTVMWEELTRASTSIAEQIIALD